MGPYSKVNSRPTPSQALAQLLRDWIPVSKQEHKEASKETVQITVWLVALATGLISVFNLSSRPFFLHDLPPPANRALIALLLATIVFGVLQRILHHLLNRTFAIHFREWHGWLLGFTAEVTRPPEPDFMTDRDKIIAALQEHFGVDYSFLRTYNVPLPGCQEAYKSQFNLWQEHEKEVTGRIAEGIAAFSGKPASWGLEFLSAKPPNFDHIRKKAVRLNAFAWTIFLIFSLMVISFVGAMSILAWNLLR